MTTFYIETEDDIDDALQLLRLSYLIQVQTLKKTPTGQNILADVNVEAELDSLEVDEEIRALVD